MPLQPQEIARRLAFLRLLGTRAADEASAPPPFSFDSVNRAHDAVEAFLALAAQHLDVPIPREFLGYWEALKVKLGRPLSSYPRMQRLNKLRVDLKHFGIEPAPNEIVESVRAAFGFIEDECPLIFGLGIADASPTALVRSAEARELLDSAELKWTGGDRQGALADLGDAFDQVVEDYEHRQSSTEYPSQFDSTPGLHFMTPFHRRVQDRDQARFEEAVIESLENLNRAVKMIGFGVDYRLLARFQATTPFISRTADGQRHVHPSDHSQHADQDDYRFCRDFVVRTALEVALGEFELPAPPDFPTP